MVENLLFYVGYPLLIWGAKKGADYLVKVSEKTEKTKIDDFAAEALQKTLELLSGVLPSKKK